MPPKDSNLRIIKEREGNVEEARTKLGVRIKDHDEGEAIEEREMLKSGHDGPSLPSARYNIEDGAPAITSKDRRTVRRTVARNKDVFHRNDLQKVLQETLHDHLFVVRRDDHRQVPQGKGVRPLPRETNTETLSKETKDAHRSPKEKAHTREEHESDDAGDDDVHPSKGSPDAEGESVHRREDCTLFLDAHTAFLYHSPPFSLSMIIAAHQPNHLPNLGFFYKMMQVDRFVIFTNAQFSHGDGWVRRHKIKGPNKDIWLTVPVYSPRRDQNIRSVLIDNSHKWQHRHRKTLEMTYGRTGEKQALGRILDLYRQPFERLVDLNVSLILLLKDLLHIETPVTLDEETQGQKQELIINLSRAYDADAYLSGAGGKEYMTDAYFRDIEKSGITHRFVKRNLTAAFPYTTLHYLFVDGIETVRSILTSEQVPQAPSLAPCH
jgi:hypothetical protein